jgi:hypothetical protein
MGRTREELDSRSGKLKNVRPNFLAQLLWPKNHTIRVLVWFIFHNLLKTME